VHQSPNAWILVGCVRKWHSVEERAGHTAHKACNELGCTTLLVLILVGEEVVNDELQGVEHLDVKKLT
jgi:endo-1,4-beta-mannosidase